MQARFLGFLGTSPGLNLNATYSYSHITFSGFLTRGHIPKISLWLYKWHEGVLCCKTVVLWKGFCLHNEGMLVKLNMESFMCLHFYLAQANLYKLQVDPASSRIVSKLNEISKQLVGMCAQCKQIPQVGCSKASAQTCQFRCLVFCSICCSASFLFPSKQFTGGKFVLFFSSVTEEFRNRTFDGACD